MKCHGHTYMYARANIQQCWIWI